MQTNMATAYSTNTISEESFDFGGLGVDWKIDGPITQVPFCRPSIIPWLPVHWRRPLHRHTHEDEYSFVLRGTLGALLGDEVVTANPR